MIASFHNHSKWSDGHTAFSEMFSYAEADGVDILGISDHFCVYPDGTSPDWSLSPVKWTPKVGQRGTDLLNQKGTVTHVQETTSA